MIPRIIHTCWFGGGDKPPLIKRCQSSWAKHLQNYKIIEWNESNFDLKSNHFVKQAYKSKKYAFCTDYVRLWALYKYGGIYLDSDVEVVKPLDCFLQHRAFSGKEIEDLWVTAVMGAEPSHPWVKMLLNYYKDRHFNPDKLIPNTKIITKLSKPLFIKDEDGIIYLQDDVRIYPVETFCSFDHKILQPIITPNAYAYHLFAGSWTNDRSQKRIDVQW